MQLCKYAKSGPSDQNRKLIPSKGIDLETPKLPTRGIKMEEAIKKKISETDTNIVLKEPPKPNPRVIIFNVPEDSIEEEIMEEINDATRSIETTRDSKNKLIKMMHSRGGSRNAIVETSIQAFQFLVGRENKICIARSCCGIEEVKRVKTCCNCSKFGHLGESCFKQEIYSFCAGITRGNHAST